MKHIFHLIAEKIKSLLLWNYHVIVKFANRPRQSFTNLQIHLSKFGKRIHFTCSTCRISNPDSSSYLIRLWRCSSSVSNNCAFLNDDCADRSRLRIDQLIRLKTEHAEKYWAVNSFPDTMQRWDSSPESRGSFKNLSVTINETADDAALSLPNMYRFGQNVKHKLKVMRLRCIINDGLHFLKALNRQETRWTAKVINKEVLHCQFVQSEKSKGNKAANIVTRIKGFQTAAYLNKLTETQCLLTDQH